MFRSLVRKTRTLAFRLALLYTVTFVLSSTAVFLITHVLVERFVLHEVDFRLEAYYDQLLNEMEMSLVPSVQAELEERAKAHGTEKVFFHILDLDGRIVASTDLSGWPRLNLSPGYLRRTLGRNPQYITVKVNDLRRQVRIIYAPIMGNDIFLAGVSMAETDSFMKLLTRVFMGMAGLCILLGASVGWQMARRAISGVEEISRAAALISQGRLDVRVNVSGKGEEIAGLAHTFNEMLETIHTLIKEMKEVNDNIAHDLRTPVTRIRGIAETNLIAGASQAEYKEMAAAIIVETENLLAIINTILEISETEAGIVAVRKNPLDLSDLVQEGVNLFRPLCDEKNIVIEMSAPLSVPYVGDAVKLQRVLANLLDNAQKFTPPGGRIGVHMSDNQAFVEIAVEDSGVGIPENDTPFVFRRFYRSDQSRNAEGFGLGLALALSMAKAHGGDISVESSPGKGSVFKVRLPRS